MGAFDQAARYAARMEPGPVLRHVLRADLAQHGWFDTRTVPMPGGADREADLVPVLEDGEGRLLLVLEFQSSHDPEKLDTTFLEVATLRKFARHGDGNALKFRAVASLVYLKGECPESVLRMTVDGRGTT